MAYCRNCGSKISEEAAYCPNCGARCAKEDPSVQQQPVVAKTEPMAVAALIMGLLTIFSYYGGELTGILAIVFAKSAKRKIEASKGLLDGTGMATAGQVIGTIGLIFWGVILFLAIIVACGIVTSSL